MNSKPSSPETDTEEGLRGDLALRGGEVAVGAEELVEHALRGGAGEDLLERGGERGAFVRLGLYRRPPCNGNFRIG